MTEEPKTLDELALERARAAAALELATETLVQAIASEVRAGREVNIAGVARRAGLSRQTVYSRLAELNVRPSS